MKYPFYARYTTLNDPRRSKRPTGTINSSVMWNLIDVVESKPRLRTYEQYIEHGLAAQNGVIAPNVNGVHQPWLLDRLSYANLIHPTKDAMHSAHNSIKDSIKLIKPNTSQPFFVNRTKRPAVVKSCRDFHVFTFMTREVNPRWPWIISRQEALLHDERFKHVLGNCYYIYLF
jgi:hypothetical protein